MTAASCEPEVRTAAADALLSQSDCELPLPVPGLVADGTRLKLTGMTKHFGPITALSDVSLDIAAGEVHCLLGENGAGKSTLCNLIFGLHQPDGGSIRLAGAPYRPQGPNDALEAGIAMVHQHFSLVPELTVVDNLLLGLERGVLRRRAFATRIEALSREYGLPIDPFATVGTLSVGERQRIEIIKCLIRKPRLLVLDEPTAVLPPDEVDALLAVCVRVAASGCSVVLVTHKLAEIKRVANRVTVLRAGQVAARSARPAEDIDALVRAMIRRDLNSLDTTLASTLGMEIESSEPTAHGARQRREDALQIDGLTVRRPDGAVRLDNFTLVVGSGEIVGIAGVEGNGQSELGAVIAGLMRPSSGRIIVGREEITNRSPAEISAAGVGIVPEDRHAVGCIAGLSLAENLHLGQLDRFTRLGFIDRRRLRASAKVMMETFDIRAAGPDAPFSSLSGGNQQKAVLARELSTRNLRFLLAAQPTRGLDVGAIEAVYAIIRAACARGTGVLLISSELDELMAVASRIVVIYRGRLVGERPAHPSQRHAIGAMMSGHPA
jgi:general nucleoside transport system ATP-binding protein